MEEFRISVSPSRIAQARLSFGFTRGRTELPKRITLEMRFTPTDGPLNPRPSEVQVRATATFRKPRAGIGEVTALLPANLDFITDVSPFNLTLGSNALGSVLVKMRDQPAPTL